MSHSRGNRADETLNVDDESIALRIGTAVAVGSTEVLGLSCSIFMASVESSICVRTTISLSAQTNQRRTPTDKRRSVLRVSVTPFVDRSISKLEPRVFIGLNMSKPERPNELS